MTWVKLDDAFSEHPKVDALSDGAFRLHVAALCWCSRWLTDGFIPDDRLPRLTPRFKSSQVKELTEGERPMWDRVEGGHQIHDYLEYQQSAEQVRAARAEAAERMRTARAKKERRSPERSPEQVPNKHRTSVDCAPDVRGVFSDPVPDPVPTTPPPQSSSSSASSSDGEDRMRRTFELITDRRYRDRRGSEPILNVGRWKAKVAGEVCREHAAKARALLAQDPSLTPEQLASRLEGSPVATIQPFKDPEWEKETPVPPEVAYGCLNEARAVMGR